MAVPKKRRSKIRTKKKKTQWKSKVSHQAKKSFAKALAFLHLFEKGIKTSMDLKRYYYY
uniref:ribosomal protein L32 n=1 Tax=Prototheca lentecrescens TaxID=2836214 RepID=UPI0030029CDA